VTEERPSFDTEEEARAFCRAREAEEPESSWLVVPRDGRWSAARTNLPRRATAEGTAVESKPKPPQADDPRTPQQRDAYWGGGG
jgi:hypothetical protein